MNYQADIVVVGAGLIGATAALKLANLGYRVLVFEKGAQLTNNECKNRRVFALGNVARQCLKDVDVWQQLDGDVRHAYSSMYVWDENSDGQLEFSAGEYQARQLGHIVDVAESSLLLQQAMIDNPSVDVLFDFSIENIQSSEQKVTITCQNGNSYVASLLLAADGGQSWVRRQLPIMTSQMSYEQQSIITRITTEKPHDNIAWQKFCQTGPIALLPLAHNESSLVWSVDSSQTAELMTLDNQAFAEALYQALDSRMGKITVLDRRFTFPLLSMRVEKYYFQRVVLLGDAIHRIHPLAGQGANLGFKDVALLMGLLTSKDGDAIGLANEQHLSSLLQRYQRQRKFDNDQTDGLMTLLNSAFAKNDGWWAQLRGLGMTTINRSAMLKKQLAQQAMG